MSIEVYLYAEVLRDGKWELAEPMVPHDGWAESDDWPHPSVPVPVLDFGPQEIARALVGGKARGTLEAITPALPARDLPDDVSEELRAWVEFWGADERWDTGWFTLTEWYDIDWDTPVRFEGEIDRWLVRRFTKDRGPAARKGQPDAVYQRPKRRFRRWFAAWRRRRELMRTAYGRPLPRSLRRYGSRGRRRYLRRTWLATTHKLRKRAVEWTGTRRNLAYGLHTKIPTLAEYGPPDQVRVVWWWGE